MFDRFLMFESFKHTICNFCLGWSEPGAEPTLENKYQESH